MRVLAITNVFPNGREPNRGIYNLQQFTALRAHCELQVVAPLPWQPWRRQASVPYQECWNEIPTFHPRYFYTPGLGRAAYALWMYASLRRTVFQLAREYHPDVLLAAWAYPDAVATAAFARRLTLPWIAKVHGTDINLAPERRLVRAQIRWGLNQAACVFAVSQPLKQRLVEIGVPAERVQVLCNGVNTQRFRLQDQRAARQATALPLERPVILYVGNLEVSKGVVDLLEAYHQIRGSAAAPLLVMVGGGSAQARLAEQIRRDGLAPQVHLVGPQPHAQVPTWIAACDVLCLPSHREGCPNVILEALACGRPVVASRVGAIPDLIDERCGALVEPQAPAALAAALAAVLGREWAADALRERVLPLSWEANAQVLATHLQRACQRHAPAPPDTGTAAVIQSSPEPCEVP
jgi:glycosyltransferase involved in cell wall biosynthesis